MSSSTIMENFNESSHYESTSSNLTSNCYGTDQSSMASEHIESDASSVIASEKPHQDAVTASEGHLDAATVTALEAACSFAQVASSSIPRKRTGSPSLHRSHNNYRPAPRPTSHDKFFYKPLNTNDYRVVYNPALDKASRKQQKEIVRRYDGEGLEEQAVMDPRNESEESRQQWEKRVGRRRKNKLGRFSYSWDKNSTGPPPPLPPCAILVTSLPNDLSEEQLLTTFTSIGRIETLTLERDHDEAQSSLGIAWIKFEDLVPRIGDPNDVARTKLQQQLARGGEQDGNKLALKAVKKMDGHCFEGEQTNVRIVLDGDRNKCCVAVAEERERRSVARAPPKAPRAMLGLAQPRRSLSKPTPLFKNVEKDLPVTTSSESLSYSSNPTPPRLFFNSTTTIPTPVDPFSSFSFLPPSSTITRKLAPATEPFAAGPPLFTSVPIPPDLELCLASAPPAPTSFLPLPPPRRLFEKPQNASYSPEADPRVQSKMYSQSTTQPEDSIRSKEETSRVEVPPRLLFPPKVNPRKEERRTTDVGQDDWRLNDGYGPCGAQAQGGFDDGW